MIQEFDTIASVATPVSNAGIGVIRISGADSMRVIGKIFVPNNRKTDVSNLETYHMYYGHIVLGKDTEDPEIIDECIVLIMQGPHSYTREDVVEIDCHGGVQVIKKILDLVCSLGVRPAEPGEFTKRAFLNGRIDLSQAEAVMDLIDSKNELSRKNSINQLRGDLSEKIINLRGEILFQIATIEAALDDPEHYDLTGYPDQLYEKNEKWISDIKMMIDSYDRGKLMKEGIRTCIVGKPNAGKSSFLNALLGEERAIVTEIAGTTRDTLEENITVDDISLQIIDTAGIRHTDDKVESIGVERAKKEIDQADLVLFLMDRSEEISQEDHDIMSQIDCKHKIVLLNKSDLDIDKHRLNEKMIREYFEEDVPIIPVSAKYHEGIDDFCRELKNMMFSGSIDVNDDIYITSARHKSLLEQSMASLLCVKNSIEQSLPEDFFTIDMMDSYEYLGKIIGEAVDDDLVNEIFSRFCTGK